MVTTPLQPIQRGKPWCVFEQRGTYEFMVHPADALWYIEHGMLVDGERFDVELIDEYPAINAWQILVQKPKANQEFIPDARRVAA